MEVKYENNKPKRPHKTQNITAYKIKWLTCI